MNVSCQEKEKNNWGELINIADYIQVIVCFLIIDMTYLPSSID